MSKDNTLLIGGAVLAFLYLQKQGQARAMAGRPGGVASMPGNVGNGLQQIATGAVAGFFQSLASGPRNNTSQTAFPNTRYDPVDATRGYIAQESVPYDPYQYEYQ